jgi:hypothetical protein
MGVSSRMGLLFRYGLLALPLLAALTPKVEANPTSPRVMKLLVIAADGTEPQYGAVTAALDQIGVPYDTFKSSCRIVSATNPKACPLPTFVTGTTANYYGIILTEGAPVYNGAYTLGWFGSADWNAIDAFTSAYGIRTLVWFDAGQARYGFNGPSYTGVTTSTTTTATLKLAVGQTVFTAVPATAQIPVAVDDYIYTNSTLLAGATSVATATIGTATYPVIVQYTSPSGTNAGSQYLDITFDSNQYMLHSQVLSYDLIKWTTNGVFLGSKHAYLTPEADDVFLADDLYDHAISGCYPDGSFQTDPVADFATDPCPTFRISGTDLQNIATWQANLNKNAKTKNFKVTLAFNGVGTVPEASDGEQPANDTLVPKAKTLAGNFYWVSHTYDHPNLDCYSLTTTTPATCVPATLAESQAEISDNVATLANFNLTKVNFDATSMVTPNVSGLANSAFIQAAWGLGIRYLVSDTSVTGIPGPNQGIVNADSLALTGATTATATSANSILEIPRYPTNIFYNVDMTTTEVNGSELDEYNLLYGGSGCVAGMVGYSCLASTQTYAEIIDSESNNLLGYMMMGYANPSMYHQTNLHSYSGANSLFTDVIGATITKFESYSNFPIISQQENAIGQLMWARMAYNASGVQGIWTPAATTGAQGSIALTVVKPASIPVTFAGTATCPTGATCESYAGQTIVTVNMSTPQTITSPK